MSEAQVRTTCARRAACLTHVCHGRKIDRAHSGMTCVPGQLYRVLFHQCDSCEFAENGERQHVVSIRPAPLRIRCRSLFPAHDCAGACRPRNFRLRFTCAVQTARLGKASLPACGAHMSRFAGRKILKFRKRKLGGNNDDSRNRNRRPAGGS